MITLAPELDELALALPVILCLSIRIGVAFAALPAPLGSVAPMPVRAALGLVVAALLVSARPTLVGTIPLEPVALSLASMEEAFVGLALGLVARLVIAAGETAGELAGSSMGLGFANVVDPGSGEESMIPARLLGLVATLVFFALGGHHVLLSGIARSVEVAPPGRTLAVLAAEGILEAGASLFGAGLRIASPVIGTLLVSQLALGLVARAAPRLQVFALSFATAATVGALTLRAAMPTAIEALTQEVRGLDDALSAVLTLT